MSSFLKSYWHCLLELRVETRRVRVGERENLRGGMRYDKMMIDRRRLYTFKATDQKPYKTLKNM